MESEQQLARDKAYKFLSGNRVAALATSDKQGTPHAAPVHFVAHKNLDIYFTSRVESRKFRNLVFNPVIAMAITDEGTMATLQLTGQAIRVEELDVEQGLLFELWSLRFNDKIWPIPTVRLLESGATNDLAVIKVTASEMTYANFKITPEGKYQNFFQKII